jgi:hypothetical protein
MAKANHEFPHTPEALDSAQRKMGDAVKGGGKGKKNKPLTAGATIPCNTSGKP